MADELDRCHADLAIAAERIAAQSELLSRQRDAAKRCLEIALEEAATYMAAKDFGLAEGVAATACRRIADRIEGEVLT